jgi:serine/threonine protein kinase
MEDRLTGAVQSLEETPQLLAISKGEPEFNSDFKSRDPNSRMIGDYRIDRTLGQGTFGKVKQGIHIHTNQKVGNSPISYLGCHQNIRESEDQGCE